MNSKETLFLSKLEEVKKLIEEKRPNAEIARVVGVKYETLKSYFSKYGIDYKGNPHRTGFGHEESRIPLSKILNNEVTYSTSSLKKRLLETGIKEKKCECCGITNWNNKSLNFELHHIDGNHYNNNLENLQILCPNCHSQTDNFRSSKKNIITGETSNNYNHIDILEQSIKGVTKPTKKKYVKKEKKELPKKYCRCCGKELTNNRKEFCNNDCYNAYRAKNSKRPSVLELINIIENYNDNLTAIGKYYGVSDNTIKKWKILYKI